MRFGRIYAAINHLVSFRFLQLRFRETPYRKVDGRWCTQVARRTSYYLSSLLLWERSSNGQKTLVNVLNICWAKLCNRVEKQLAVASGRIYAMGSVWNLRGSGDSIEPSQPTGDREPTDGNLWRAVPLFLVKLWRHLCAISRCNRLVWISVAPAVKPPSGEFLHFKTQDQWITFDYILKRPEVHGCENDVAALLMWSYHLERSIDDQHLPGVYHIMFTEIFDTLVFLAPLFDSPPLPFVTCNTITLPNSKRVGDADIIAGLLEVVATAETAPDHVGSWEKILSLFQRWQGEHEEAVRNLPPPCPVFLTVINSPLHHPAEYYRCISIEEDDAAKARQSAKGRLRHLFLYRSPHQRWWAHASLPPLGNGWVYYPSDHFHKSRLTHVMLFPPFPPAPISVVAMQTFVSLRRLSIGDAVVCRHTPRRIHIILG